MTPTTEAHPLVADYVRRLERELGDLPRDRREEIVRTVRDHIADALAELGPGAGEAGVRNVLDRVGDVSEIAREARSRFGLPSPTVPRTVDYVGLVLLTVGSLVLPIVGWVAGLVIVWRSAVWSVRDKVLAAVIFPLGMFPAFFLAGVPVSTRVCSTSLPGGVETCTTNGPPVSELVVGWAVVLLSAVGTVAVAVYLGWRARRAARTYG